ncbi:MarR family winged helix-turn-helix transcriptional regulator [Rhizobium sp. LjRoot254]|uniref:MarR family winged helix-turn-helix transcriptional regulator n=1 Tax=Rhizobium sp. LjRoot254 TaxID=3342297 RepID=UPI003ED04DA4
MDTKLAEEGFDDIKPHYANIFTFVPPEGMQVSQLTELAHVRKQSMTQTIEELEQLGYVERRPDPGDKRGKLVFLTERGKKVSPIARAAGRLVDQHWAEMTSAEEIEGLRKALRSVLAATTRQTQG